MKCRLPQLPGRKTLFQAFKASREPCVDYYLNTTESSESCPSVLSQSCSVGPSESSLAPPENSVSKFMVLSKIYSVVPSDSCSWSIRKYFGHRLSLPESQKLSAVSSNSKSSTGWKAPLRGFGKKNRKDPDFCIQ